MPISLITCRVQKYQCLVQRWDLILRQIMSMLTDERSPLLEEPSNIKKHTLGPHDISRSNRFGILAGVWLATFLSVSR